MQVSKLLLSLPAPTAAPMALLPPPPLLPPRPGVTAATTAADYWSGTAAVDESFELPMYASLPASDDADADEPSKLQEPSGAFVSGTAHDVPPPAAAAEGLAEEKADALPGATLPVQQLQWSASSPPASDPRSIAPEHLSTSELKGSQLRTTRRQAAVTSPWHDDRTTEPARPLSGATTAVDAATDAAVRGWQFGRRSSFKQPDPAAWGAPGAAAEPPSPTFSAMERAASAAALVAARLFDTEVLPTLWHPLLTRRSGSTAAAAIVIPVYTWCSVVSDSF